ncbi:hypothetical protein PG988_006531 [Apiospora saccharicola]
MPLGIPTKKLEFHFGRLRHKPLAPRNADEDPYTLAAMIALAERPGADGAKVEVRVVTTSTQKNGHILRLQGNRAWHAPGSV